MSKLNNLKAQEYLAPFKQAMGTYFDKVCNDINSWVGQKESTIVSKQTGWTVGTKGRLVSRDGHTLQLDLNAGYTPLILFGMQLTTINLNGSRLDGQGKVAYDMSVQADIPFSAKSWFDAKYVNATVAEKPIVTK